MVFYRKYRPQTIAELDSPALQETLRAVLSQKEIPHAFLFTGPKGLGKTSTARIIAKVLNCTNPKRDGIEPCNECEQCVSITNGTNIDVLEIDGASNRGIDEIRELRERVNLAPSAAKKKVYIIDEVHMLTTEAFNALLKTIEEPPAHVVFIFATTEPQKVPATIISRCFHISLNKATKEEIVHSLKRIVKEEKIDIDDDALAFIAEMADGGYRDATKYLEELVAVQNGKKIDKKFVEGLLKVAGVDVEIEDLLGNLHQRNAVAALAKIEIIVSQGTSLKYFTERLLSELHKVLLRSVGAEKVSSNIPEFSLEEVKELVALFSEAYQQIKYAVIPSLPLELAVVQFCQQNEVAESGLGKDSGQARMTTNKSAMTMQDAFKKEQNIKVKQILTGAKPVAPAKPTVEHTQENLPKDVKDNAVLLENLIYKVKPLNVSVAGVLRSCIVQSVSDERVVLQTAYTFHKERLEDAKAREIVAQALKEITGKNLQVSVVLKEK